MRNEDNLTEISIEDNKGITILEYYSNSIPRCGETILYKQCQYRVYDIIHNIVEFDDEPTNSYVSVKVQLIKKEGE